MAARKQDGKNMHWKERWEMEAGFEHERYSLLSEQELLERVEQDRTGLYYTIWRVIGDKGTIQNTPMVLWEYLRAHPGEYYMLQRYHCAAALFKILDMPDPGCNNPLRHSVQWDHHGEDARQKALAELKEMIIKTQMVESDG